jgi:phage baseplate assembly protein W
MPIGFVFPFTQATGSLGYFEVTRNELDAVYANIRSLLMTNWGERVNHYFMGGNLREFLFEPMRGDDLKNRVADRIISQINTWIPYVTIDELNILFPEDDSTIQENSMFIRISFRLTSKPDLTGNLPILVRL